MTRVSDSGEALYGWPPQAPQVWARAFGRLEDLEVDFHAPRPYAVTEILARCVHAAGGVAHAAAQVWQWTVGRRTQALLAVVRAGGVTSVTAQARCEHNACGEQIELEFGLDSFAHAAEAQVCEWRSEANHVVLRLPTGDDQRRWLDGAPDDADALPLWLGTRLVREVDGLAPDAAWQLPAVWLPEVEDALAAQDPVTDLSVPAVCPRCGAELNVEVDFEALLLARLADLQHAMLRDIHVLARGYHWSEAQILALPAWRRAYYLAATRGEA